MCGRSDCEIRSDPQRERVPFAVFVNLGQDCPDDVNRCVGLNWIGTNCKFSHGHPPWGISRVLTQSIDRSHSFLETDSWLL